MAIVNAPKLIKRNVDIVGQAIEQGIGEAFGVEQTGPLVEGR